MRAQLEQAIVDNPDDEDAFLVYADAVGGVEGELVVLQHRLAQGASDVVAREAELRAAIEYELLGAALQWRWGYAQVATIHLFELDEIAAARRLARILDHHALRFVAALSISMEHGCGDAVIRALAERPRPTVRELRLIESTGDPSVGCDETTAALWPQLPNLQSVSLEAERPLFDAMAHPRVAEMELNVLPFGDAWSWDLPALRSLAWDPTLESDCDIRVLDGLWEQPLPQLASLTLGGSLTCEEPLFDRAEVRAFVRRLDRLRLPFSAFCARGNGVRTLLEHADALAHLSQLVVDGEAEEPNLLDMGELVRRLPRAEFAVV